SLAFIHLCVKTILDLSDDEAFECLTDGGQDFGIDALQISEEYDGAFIVSVFQGKYKRELEATSNFPESGIESLIRAIRYLFDPDVDLLHINTRLLTRVEEIRSLIRDGYIPQVRAIGCNNGLKWTAAADDAIRRAAFGDQVTWEHINHDRLVQIFQSTKPVEDTLKLTGKAIIEDFNFSRVLIGRISVSEIYALIQRHGERLLERNIRRYLGLQGNRVNEAIRETLIGPEKSNFYFYNNGITLVCNKFGYNNLQSGDYQVKVEDLQIINGGQTCMTIYKTLGQMQLDSEDAYLLLRLYQLPSDNHDLVKRITYATNSQNPVDLRDLRANDERQKRLEIDIGQLGYQYRRKRTDSALKSTDITSGAAAEAILSVWRRRPHQAKFFSREHFGKLYDLIFTQDLNGAQTIIAVLIYRICENRRKRPFPDDPPFIRYASCFLAMQMGRYLIRDLNVNLNQLDHRNFSGAESLLRMKGDEYLTEAISDLLVSLDQLYGEGEISLQQLAATFRRGDLTEKLR
ncbi:AIPR family protein, partial [Methanocalculus sp.]|uniref:AIPR family protein n=1 Tax=Methanocalculus sp. TaxID=2004547 RepID=UPI002728D021